MIGGGVGYLSDMLVYAESKRWLGTWRYFVSCKSWHIFTLRFNLNHKRAAGVLAQLGNLANDTNSNWKFTL